MSTAIKEQARFDARLPKEQKQFFERAAYLGVQKLNRLRYSYSSRKSKRNNQRERTNYCF